MSQGSRIRCRCGKKPMGHLVARLARLEDKGAPSESTVCRGFCPPRTLGKGSEGATSDTPTVVQRIPRCYNWLIIRTYAALAVERRRIGLASSRRADTAPGVMPDRRWRKTFSDGVVPLESSIVKSTSKLTIERDMSERCEDIEVSDVCVAVERPVCSDALSGACGSERGIRT